MPTPFKNADLLPSIVTDAIADKIGGTRAPEVCTAILQRLEANGWAFIRADDLVELRRSRDNAVTLLRDARALAKQAVHRG